jgi:site-specific recombinase XerD
MSMQEVSAAFAQMSGTTRVMAEFIYGTEIRIHECVTLRVKDIDFDRRSFTVRAAKGNKDRATLLPEALSRHCATISPKWRSSHIWHSQWKWLRPDAQCPVQKVSFSLQVTGLAIGLPFNGGSALAQ